GAVVEAPYRRHVVSVTFPRFQVGMTTCAGAVGGGRQANGASMFYMARGASRRKGLLFMMDWAVMTRQARLVGDYPPEITRLAHVASVTVKAEDSVRRGD